MRGGENKARYDRFLAPRGQANPCTYSSLRVQIEIRRPDDWHLHLRDGAAMAAVVPFTAARFARAIVMPNLKPPVTTTAAALSYRERILQALPSDSDFSPLMTLYLTDRTDPAEIERASRSEWVKACKLYPAGATTNSDSGVTDISRIDAVLSCMSERGLPLLVHGEVTGRAIDVFEREHRFIEEVLAPTLKRFPKLRVVFEHITTAAAVEFVKGARDGVGATITPQHLLHNRNAIFEGGVRPHYYCLPILKTEPDREALMAAATSGDPRFFLGTDSAPHEQRTKENACGCAGMFSAHAGIELYAEAFDSVGRLDRLEGFASDFGADFYRLPRNSGRIRLEKRDWTPPASYPFAKDGDGKLVPMRAGETVRWQMVS
jgi:dihydroorotase